ncbi:hypothetical protein [Methylobacterium sp. 13MFTsu3.1M2]|uniref:hypothetical protein n=1 Tax=Methylobacterium sp. 13MFTsu3.1M2 TaxID=1502776 RepID=UPI001114F24F|nr:hypothetical protein [Methylobacterium sp. 13MFTsu3.1M2]
MKQIDKDEQSVRHLLPLVRAEAQKVGTMHGAWDLILDVEALLNHQPTVLKFGTREKAMSVFRGMLESRAPRNLGYERRG